jgi:hypothetical protein
MRIISQRLLTGTVACFSMHLAIAAPMASKITAITVNQQHVVIQVANPTHATVCANPGWVLSLDSAQDRELYHLLIPAWLQQAPVVIEGTGTCDEISGSEKMKSLQWEASSNDTKTYSNLTETIKQCAYDKVVHSSQINIHQIPPLNQPGDVVFDLNKPMTNFTINVTYPSATDVTLKIVTSPWYISNNMVWNTIDDQLNDCRK